VSPRSNLFSTADVQFWESVMDKNLSGFALITECGLSSRAKASHLQPRREARRWPGAMRRRCSRGEATPRMALDDKTRELARRLEAKFEGQLRLDQIHKAMGLEDEENEKIQLNTFEEFLKFAEDDIDSREIRRPVLGLLIVLVAILARSITKRIIAWSSIVRWTQVLETFMLWDFRIGILTYGLIPLALMIASRIRISTKSDIHRRFIVCYGLSSIIYPLSYGLALGGYFTPGLVLHGLVRSLGIFSVWFWEKLNLEMFLYRRVHLVLVSLDAWRILLAIQGSLAVPVYWLLASFRSIEGGTGIALNRVFTSSLSAVKSRTPTRITTFCGSNLSLCLTLLICGLYFSRLLWWFALTINLGRERSGRNNQTYLEQKLINMGYFQRPPPAFYPTSENSTQLNLSVLASMFPPGQNPSRGLFESEEDEVLDVSQIERIMELFANEREMLQGKQWSKHRLHWRDELNLTYEEIVLRGLRNFGDVKEAPDVEITTYDEDSMTLLDGSLLRNDNFSEKDDLSDFLSELSGEEGSDGNSGRKKSLRNHSQTMDEGEVDQEIETLLADFNKFSRRAVYYDPRDMSQDEDNFEDYGSIELEEDMLSDDSFVYIPPDGTSIEPHSGSSSLSDSVEESTRTNEAINRDNIPLGGSFTFTTPDNFSWDSKPRNYSKKTNTSAEDGTII